MESFSKCCSFVGLACRVVRAHATSQRASNVMSRRCVSTLRVDMDKQTTWLVLFVRKLVLGRLPVVADCARRPRNEHSR